MNTNYSIPLKFDSIFNTEGGVIETCSEQQSIDAYLDLLITTCPGEHKFDPHFGCKIWDIDFEKVTSQIKWESQCINLISDMVAQYESRLKDVNVICKIIEISKTDSIFQAPMIKKQVNIRINSTLVSSGERCCFYYKIYMGPISSE